MIRTNSLLALIVGMVCLTYSDRTLAADFSLEDKPGEYLDVQLDGKLVARYMNGHDTSTPARHSDTYKPYLHVFDSEGKAAITKGPGGLFPHHRGIFVGWNKIKLNGKSYDRWHMHGGDIVHQKFLDQRADANSATFTSQTFWEGEKGGQPIIVEDRTVAFRRGTAPARLTIDFTTKLASPHGDLTLDGDPEHAGVQFRPAQEVVLSETKYVFPKEHADAHKDRDYPWVGETFTLGGARHSVVHMNHPDNPKGTRYSAYRDYGRFGAFPTAEIKQGESLTLKYRFLIIDGEMPYAGAIQKSWDEFASVLSPTPVPAITVNESDKSSRK